MKHLGEQGEHGVESEVVGATLTLDIIKGTPRPTDVDIFTDCQPAISAISSPRAAQAVPPIHRRLLRARPSLEIRIHIDGNASVEAALGASSPLPFGPSSSSPPSPRQGAMSRVARVPVLPLPCPLAIQHPHPNAHEPLRAQHVPLSLPPRPLPGLPPLPDTRDRSSSSPARATAASVSNWCNLAPPPLPSASSPPNPIPSPSSASCSRLPTTPSGTRYDAMRFFLLFSYSL
ncbi:hypothetical protein C8R46DRAFT_1214125 [Mycena filopes]|nr:hypothetical protein C8R46DRAFT_1214125 [Mycena filopes]